MEFVVALFLVGGGIGIAYVVFLTLFTGAKGFHKFRYEMIMLIGAAVAILLSIFGGFVIRLIT
jgi:hypothetical protein